MGRDGGPSEAEGPNSHPDDRGPGRQVGSEAASGLARSCAYLGSPRRVAGVASTSPAPQGHPLGRSSASGRQCARREARVQDSLTEVHLLVTLGALGHGDAGYGRTF